MLFRSVAFNDQLLDQKENNFLAGLAFDKDQCGAAFLDVSTGSFQVAQGSLDYIGTLIASLNPKEIVVQRGYEKGVKEKYGDNLYISTVEEWAFVYDAAVERLKKQFNVESLKGFAVDSFPLGICSAGALMVYLEQTQHTGLKNIWANSTISAVWRSKADLPAMFGPVRMMICCFLLSRNMSLGTYSSPAGINVSMTGWRPALMSRVRSLVISGRL